MKSQPFPVIAYNKFIGFADGNILSWCPTMDLLAISMNRMSIWVFRINGERIYSINNKSLILDISWNPNGKFFCVSGIDGYCKIYDSNSGKLINTIDSKQKSINLINWCYHKSVEEPGRFDNLFKVDVLANLPKLSLDNEIFTNNNASNVSNHNNNYQLDEINDTEGLLNFMITIRSHTELSITFNGLFTVDCIKSPEHLKFMCHANNSDLLAQYFLVTNKSDDSSCLLKMSLDIPDSNYLRNYLMEIILQSCKVKSIMNYINEQLVFLNEEVKPLIQLFDRHLSNFKDTLYSNVDLTTNFPTGQESKCKVVNSLFDLLLTGLIPANLKDFWLNQLGERGLKKLSKVCNSIYDLIRKVCFNQLVSSLERLLIILNTLQGLNKWLESMEIGNNGSNGYLGLDLESINSIVALTKNLLKYFYQLIWDINEEQKLFNDFINWVKIGVIDKLAKEDDIDSYYKTLHVNYKTSNLIKYFNEYLFKSKLFNYFEINLPMNEILLQEVVETNLMDKYIELNRFVESNLLCNITDYIKSIVKFDDLVPLNISSTHMEKMKIFNGSDFGIISCINHEESTLSLIKFSLSSSDLQTKIIKLKDPIITYEIINELKILLLIDSSPKYYLESFNFDDVILQDSCPISYASISPINQNVFHSDAINRVSEPKYLAINSDKSRSVGCLLDANKQNYLVFELK
ncbi:DEHA2B08316p [Debaryomyces hansenii CBS767]|uniref:Anaphase-promoting complex subunit 4 n=1 Tax=Debaryomyces hansenii (strain ATCC 36239 / CBS 767 / BCRC 21394 / JCM 1990 / NBRC 0083 / IGC 2968) TaxID=284592 RepID=Q6BWV1_DEBHA|nr:DEHA2B08316p [Debaryomyces hansenii CBS767]CAG85322.2 DEHA2B08316p [Debaryomyces hansenii CBS767]|eukprot:XP_457318.2 DEHA2B08316p [Debaryomyces hansenii CBS767]